MKHLFLYTGLVVGVPVRVPDVTSGRPASALVGSDMSGSKLLSDISGATNDFQTRYATPASATPINVGRSAQLPDKSRRIKRSSYTVRSYDVDYGGKETPANKGKK
ncbi:hypothetical protein DSO57_1016059 [Entomophthora muscae]|uniref:Uncharacterized protein n=1 Tax=Entomophthora muscae TaxID=34485 RepID=A0ACC2UPT8_9FUNG|nr:hypothetical protein DSO57_1016059 [Entomophthora muscae]